jgi:pyruvate/2-oxoglutarate dehydrogenase complex dihydrolipoamide dehydrogenase (E3) component
MQAALTAAARGHSVLLCEKGERLGGILMIEEGVPFKQKLTRYIESQKRKIDRAGIDVRLRTEVTPAFARSIAPDVIIAALGAEPIRPPIEGLDSANVLGVEEVYQNPSAVKGTVAIIGGGLVGIELAIWLADKGHEVIVVEMLPYTAAIPPAGNTSELLSDSGQIRPGFNIFHGHALHNQLRRLESLEVFVSTKVLAIQDGTIDVAQGGETRAILADTVVHAVGLRPRCEAALALCDCAPEFFQIGDCLSPATIMEATQAGWQAARDIGRI